MQTTPTSLSVSSQSLLDHVGRGRASSGDAPIGLPSLVESTELLKGGKTVGILHNGSLYRLQATKLGKLILTK
jgi:hemin uptake protein HemP